MQKVNELLLVWEGISGQVGLGYQTELLGVVIHSTRATITSIENFIYLEVIFLSFEGKTLGEVTAKLREALRGIPHKIAMRNEETDPHRKEFEFKLRIPKVSGEPAGLTALKAYQILLRGAGVARWEELARQLPDRSIHNVLWRKKGDQRHHWIRHIEYLMQQLQAPS